MLMIFNSQLSRNFCNIHKLFKMMNCFIFQMSYSPVSSTPISFTTSLPISSSLASQSSNIVGPFLTNSSVTCFNTSLLPGWNSTFLLHPPNYYQELQQAAVPCPVKVDKDKMLNSLVHFWNIAFTLMIITAVGGNTGVLWIVIRKIYIIS